MDFSKEIMDSQGHGAYSHIKLNNKLPNFFLAYLSDPSDSGKIHHNVFAR
jgi:glucuronokinase